MTNSLEKFNAAKAPLQADVANAKGELDIAINHLASMPESLERRKAVAEAKRKHIEATSALDCLEAAEAEVHRQARAAARASRVARREDERRQIREMHTVIDRAATAILKHIQHLGPLLSAYDKLAQEHSELCLGLVREAELGLTYGRQHLTEQIRTQADPNRGSLSSAMGAALCSAGLGRIGPHLFGVEPQPASDEFNADPIAAYMEHEKSARRNVEDNLDRADQRLDERVDEIDRVLAEQGARVA